MCLFIVFSVVTLVHTGIVIASSDKFIAALTDYFKCEALGHVTGKCNRSEFEQYYNPYMSAISYIFIGLIPLGIINFVLKWNSVKKVAEKSFHWPAKKPSQNTNLSNLSLGRKVTMGSIN